MTLFLAGLQWRYIMAVAGLAAAAAPALWYVMHEYQRNRVRTFLDPESDPLGSGWNIIQSKIAVGSGGVLGKGWLNGTQSNLEFIPERHTDFILAVLSEEFGLMGVLALFAVYVFITGRGFIYCKQCQEHLFALLAGSLSLTFFVYVHGQWWNGVRNAAGSGCSFTAGQLWWNIHRDTFGRFRHINVHSWPPEFHTLARMCGLIIRLGENQIKCSLLCLTEHNCL